MNYVIVSKDFFSNCLIEAVKAKIRNPHVKISVCMPWENEMFCPHVMWSDGINDYDFGIEKPIPMLLAWTIHKGHIRKRQLGFSEKYKRVMTKRNKMKRMKG